MRSKPTVKKYRFVIGAALLLSLLGLIVYVLQSQDVGILHPHGLVAVKERNLIIFTSLLSLLVVIPVFVMTFYIVWKYQAHKGATYTPDWDHNRVAESIWWGFPCLLIGVLAVITWQSSHALDPFRQLDSTIKPMPVQVVALQWKWLFIYPEQHIASVNYLVLPEKVPIDFEITADAPMNSFWIPQLGGQIYAMSGMSTHLHLRADRVGSFRGSSANVSGQGFADMHFTAQAITAPEFSSWVETTQQSNRALDALQYNALAKPSRDMSTDTFGSVEHNLYDTIVMKYMMPLPHMGDANLPGIGSGIAHE